MEYIESSGRGLKLILDLNWDRILAVLIIIGSLFVMGVLLEPMPHGLHRL